MSVSEIRAKIKAGVWHAIARSKVDLSVLPQEEVNKLVESITDEVMQEMDDVLSEVTGQPSSRAAAEDEDEDEEETKDEFSAEEEKVLWEGRPFMSLSVHYKITSQRLRISEGLLGKAINDIELVRIQDMDASQSLTERAFNVGDIHVHSHDPDTPEVTLSNVSNFREVHEILRNAVVRARNRSGLTYREEM